MKLAPLLILLAALPAHAKSGSPKQTTCEIHAYVADHDIKQMEELDVLLHGASLQQLASRQADCSTYEGSVTVCENEVDQAGLNVRYVFNTQNGGLELRDTVSGQENSAGWLNQYELTKSGYLPLTADLVNRRGGLLGNPRIFEVTASCGAAGGAWDGH
jgi:hypothetical protein